MDYLEMLARPELIDESEMMIASELTENYMERYAPLLAQANRSAHKASPPDDDVTPDKRSLRDMISGEKVQQLNELLDRKSRGY